MAVQICGLVYLYIICRLPAPTHLHSGFFKIYSPFIKRIRFFQPSQIPLFSVSIGWTQDTPFFFSLNMDVSKNNCTPKSFILIGIFHYKPSILGLPYFRKHPYRQTQREQGLTAAGDLGLSSERSQAGVSAQCEGGSGDSCA